MSDRNKSAWVPGILSLLTLSALAVAADDGRNPLDAPGAKKPPPAPTAYHVRCWQYGRLLFEERDLQVPPEVIGGIKLRGTDRNKQPVVVTDTGSATCLVRAVPAVKP
jgi:hypothetical protein